MTIDTGMKVYGVRVTGSTIVVVGDGKVITWDLPAINGALDARLNVDNSVRTTIFDHSSIRSPVPAASISPDLKYIVIAGGAVKNSEGLHIYDVSTGKCLTSTETFGWVPWFTPDGCEVWCGHYSGEWDGWMVVKDSKSGLPKLESTQHQPERCPWRPSSRWDPCDGWVLGSGGKRLLWLPPHWRSDWARWAWGGRFFALVHPGLSEVVILELPEE